MVIGILATITIVAYNGIQQRATGASLQSDLKGASTQLKMYQVDNSAYPTSNDCSTGATPAPPKICLKSSAGNTYVYTSNNAANPQTFSLTATNTNGNSYVVTDNSSPVAVVVDSWVNWYSGFAATALAGKHVYKTDLGNMQYKTTADAVASPQGATGLDPSYPSNMSLVSPQTNPGVDFSAYPAQNACKAIGGRLPNMQELNAIYAGRASYGNNFQADYYWPSTVYNSNYAYGVYFVGGNTGYYDKTNYFCVRCVSG